MTGLIISLWFQFEEWSYSAENFILFTEAAKSLDYREDQGLFILKQVKAVSRYRAARIR